MEEEMTEEVVVISEGCRMQDGVDVGGALLHRRHLGHLCGGMVRPTGGDGLWVSFYLRSALFMIMILTVLYL